jgi:hypothetical protein
VAQYDIEKILSDVKAHLLANLNAQLSALDTEKNDGIILKPVDAAAYHLQSLEDRVDMADPILLFGESDEPEMQSVGSHLATTYFVTVWLILTDNGLDPQIVTRLFRYRRALVDVFRLKWDRFAREHKMKINQSSPTPPFKDQDTNWTARAVGVRIALTSAT